MYSKTKIGICSLSETHVSELKWAHYAGNYSGICISYVSRRLKDRLGDSTRLSRVAYGEKLPLLTSAEARDVETAARIILSHKKMNWYYEREWRVLGRKGKNHIRHVNKPWLIPDVYLGSRIDIAHEAKILRELKPLGLNIFKMNISGYQHKWTEL